MAKQIMFLDMEDEPHMKHGGIMLDNGDVVCGCCGGIFEAAERGETWELLKEFDCWVNIEKEICGDDWVDEKNSILWYDESEGKWIRVP
jgi:hypothetical protein